MLFRAPVLLRRILDWFEPVESRLFAPPPSQPGLYQEALGVNKDWKTRTLWEIRGIFSPGPRREEVTPVSESDRRDLFVSC